MPEYQVFFFGAGASKAEGGLLTSELLLEALKHPDVDQSFVSIVKRFLTDLFQIENIDIVDSTKQLPGFEELLTLVDVALLKKEEFSQYWNRKRLLELREALVYCIAKILRIKLQSRPEDTTSEYHKRFIQNIFSNGIDTRSVEFSFISLNYDILLDYALINLYPTWDVDYGISFRNFREPRSEHKIKC